jgi:hypothetical protein
MEEFFGVAKVWPQGPTLHHIYYVPDLERLEPMFAAYDPIVAGADCVEAVPRPWIHATMCKITVAPARIAPSTIAALTKRLCARLAQRSPVELVAGPALAGTSAVTIDLTPDAGWSQLRAAVVAEIEAELGPGVTSVGSGERPHLTLAYGCGPGESGHLQSRLRRATDIRVPLLLDRLELVEVTQDLTARSYTWGRPSIGLPVGMS